MREAQRGCVLIWSYNVDLNAASTLEDPSFFWMGHTHRHTHTVVLTEIEERRDGVKMFECLIWSYVIM